MADEYSDEQFLEFIVKSIVDNPDDVEVGRQVDEMGFVDGSSFPHWLTTIQTET